MIETVILDLVIVAVAVWVGSWLLGMPERRYRRDLARRSIAEFDAREVAWERENAERERNRTQWSHKDSGWDIKRIPGTAKEDRTRPDQPWNYRRLVQGLIHSSGRAEGEAWNARCEESRLHAMEWRRGISRYRGA